MMSLVGRFSSLVITSRFRDNEIFDGVELLVHCHNVLYKKYVT